VTKADRKLDPRFTYSSIRQKEMISWGITELFVERIMHMDKKRVEAIKSLGDRIARYIGHHDARLLKRLYFARNDQEFRRTLIRADFDDLGKGNEPIMLYDEFVYAFFEDEGEVARYDYNFARDLLLIRIIEQLHKEWTDEHEDVLQEISAELEKQDEESEEN
jgi:CRISPR-associated protein Cst1